MITLQLCFFRILSFRVFQVSCKYVGGCPGTVYAGNLCSQRHPRKVAPQQYSNCCCRCIVRAPGLTWLVLKWIDGSMDRWVDRCNTVLCRREAFLFRREGKILEEEMFCQNQRPLSFRCDIVATGGTVFIPQQKTQ